MKTYLRLVCFSVVFIAAGCCTLFHDCPSQDYWTASDKLAQELNKRYGNNFIEIVPLPLGDYKIGTTIDKGLANGFSCIFPEGVISNFPADFRLATESNVISADLSLTSPTNISQFTAGFNIDSSKSVYMSFSHMTLSQVDPGQYNKIFSSENQCVNDLNSITKTDTNTMIIVGYLMGRFQMSQSKNFDIDLNAAAYGANGKIAYTNAGGWTVASTNSVPLFAMISKPIITSSGASPTNFATAEHIELVMSFPPKSFNSYSVDLAQPDHKAALEAVSP